jgi:hypothetical protein
MSVAQMIRDQERRLRGVAWRYMAQERVRPAASGWEDTCAFSCIELWKAMLILNTNRLFIPSELACKKSKLQLAIRSWSNRGGFGKSLGRFLWSDLVSLCAFQSPSVVGKEASEHLLLLVASFFCTPVLLESRGTWNFSLSSFVVSFCGAGKICLLEWHHIKSTWPGHGQAWGMHLQS